MENSKKKSVSISEKLYQDIKEYCVFNGLRFNDFVEEILTKQFNIEKYGDSPFAFMEKQLMDKPPIEKQVSTEETTSELSNEDIYYVLDDRKMEIKPNIQMDKITVDGTLNKDGSFEQEETIVENKPKKRKLK